MAASSIVMSPSEATVTHSVRNLAIVPQAPAGRWNMLAEGGGRTIRAAGCRLRYNRPSEYVGGGRWPDDSGIAACRGIGRRKTLCAPLRRGLLGSSTFRDLPPAPAP